MHWLNRLEQLFAISTLSNPPFFSVCVCSHRRAQPSSASSFTAKTAPFSYEGLAAISDTVELPDGRDLGFARYGNKDGPQTFYLHGLPGSRVEGGVFFEQAAKHLGAGIIFIDRPSVGLSSPHPHRTITDHAQDVLHLARHLDLKAWRVIGVSGGGPYALACARHHPPECLRGVAVCAGIGP